MKIGKSVKRVKKYGNTLWIPLPSEFTKSHGIEKNDDVDVFFDHILHVKPIDKKVLKEQMAKAKELFESIE